MSENVTQDAPPAHRPAAGSELGPVVGVPAWPPHWPLPQEHGPLAPYQIRTHMLKKLEPLVATAVAEAEAARCRGEEVAAARAELRVMADVLKPLCHRVSKLLDTGLEEGRWPRSDLHEDFRDAIDRELRNSMPKRWRIADGGPLPVDELWPLLDPRHALSRLAQWLEAGQADWDETAGEQVRLHLDALEPAEVAVVKIGVPTDRQRQARVEALRLIDQRAGLVEIGRAAAAVAAAWEALWSRIMAVKISRPTGGPSTGSRCLPSKTVRPIRFDELDGAEFERLVLAFLFVGYRWRTLEWYGQVGGDQGRDIWGVLEDERRAPGVTVCVQCANRVRLTSEKIRDDLRKLADAPEGLPDRYLVVSGGKLSAKLRDAIKAAARKHGIKDVDVWSGVDLEERLQSRAPQVLRRFFDGEHFPDDPATLRKFLETP